MNANVILFLVLLCVGFPALAQSGADEKIHIIREGDTLSEIAQSEGFSSKELCVYNQISNCDKIFIGKEIRIPSPSGKEGATDTQPKEVTTVVLPVSLPPSESEKISSKGISEERRIEIPAIGIIVSSKSTEEVLDSAIAFNPEVIPDERIFDVRMFDRNQEVEKQREEIIALQKQITETENDQVRMNSAMQLQREKISWYALFIFLSVLGNILLFLFLMKNIIKGKLRTRTNFFAVSKSKREEEETEVYNLQCKINALESKNKFLEEQIQVMLEKKLFLSLGGRRIEIRVEKFDLDRLTRRVIPIITFFHEGKRFTLKIFNVKRFEKWLGEDPGRRFQILDPIVVL